MVKVFRTNASLDVGDVPSKFSVLPLEASLSAEDLFNALHDEDESWVLTPPEEGDAEGTYLIQRGDSPGYQFLADDEKGYLLNNYNNYHFSGSQLEDFIDFIKHSEKVVDELLDQAVSLKSSRLNAAVGEPAPFDPVAVAKEVLIIARERATVEGLESCTWGRPTKVDRNKVMVKRKQGETDEEMAARRQRKVDWLGDDETDVVVTQTLFMNKEWVTKMALQLDFHGESEGTEQRRVRGEDGKSSFTDVHGVKRDLTAVFIPNHDPERNAGVGSTEKSAGTNKGGSIKDVTYMEDFTVIDTGNIAADYSKLISWVANHLYTAVLAVFKYPPKRLVKRMFENGLIKIKPTKRKTADGQVIETIIDDEHAAQWLKELPKTSAFELVREGYVPGRDVLTSHPEWATQMLNEGLVEPEDVIRIKGNDPNTLYNMVKKGQLPAEKVVALAKDERLAQRLAKDSLYSPLTGEESTDIEEIVQAVADGKMTPSKAWEINRKSVDALLERGLITPKEAYHLDPNGLANMMRKGYIGKSEGQKLSPQIKRRFTKEEWDALKASIHQFRKGRHLNASTAANFEECVGNCDDVTTIDTLNRIGEFEANPFDEQSPAEWFNSLDDDAKNIVFSLVMTWLIGDSEEPVDSYML